MLDWALMEVGENRIGGNMLPKLDAILYPRGVHISPAEKLSGGLIHPVSIKNSRVYSLGATSGLQYSTYDGLQSAVNVREMKWMGNARANEHAFSFW